MNPSIKFSFEQGFLRVGIIVKKLEQRTGLRVRYDSQAFSGKRQYYAQGVLMFETEEPVENHHLTFEGVKFELRFSVSKNQLVFSKSHGNQMGYFDACLISILQNMGGDSFPENIDIPNFVNFPYVEAKKLEGFIE